MYVHSSIHGQTQLLAQGTGVYAMKVLPARTSPLPEQYTACIGSCARLSCTCVHGSVSKGLYTVKASSYRQRQHWLCPLHQWQTPHWRPVWLQLKLPCHLLQRWRSRGWCLLHQRHPQELAGMNCGQRWPAVSRHLQQHMARVSWDLSTLRCLA